MNTSLLKRPSAFVPLIMSVAALGLVLVYVASGNAHAGDTNHDERGPARLFQLLLAAQLPIVAFFAIKWLPRAPKEGLIVLGLQAGAGIAAIATVLFLEQ